MASETASFMSLDSTGDKSKEELYFINNDPDKWSLLKFLKRKKHSLSAHNIEWKDEYKVYEENIGGLVNPSLRESLTSKFRVSDFNEYLYIFF
jgi:hypothetical protein